MKTICFFALFIFQAQAQSLFDTDRLLDKTLPSGTAPREEYELKLAFQLNRDFKVKELQDLLNSKLRALVTEKAFSFPKIARTPYYLDPDFQAFMFRDIYFDTKDLHVLRINSAYRLRKRWTQIENFIRYQLFPFNKDFFPTRCEIQAKIGYEIFHDISAVKVQESRFEFREDSLPFSQGPAPPPPPWLDEEYFSILKVGYFKQYKMYPSYMLAKALRKNYPKLAKLDFLPMVEVRTKRHRTHLNLKHPWGSGPNPEQAFIITIDKVDVTNMGIRNRKGVASQEDLSFLEVEIEIERNTSTEIDKIIALETAPEGVPKGIFKVSQQLSSKAKSALKSDLTLIRETIINEISQLTKRERLPLKSKYSRIVDLLSSR